MKVNTATKIKAKRYAQLVHVYKRWRKNNPDAPVPAYLADAVRQTEGAERSG